MTRYSPVQRALHWIVAAAVVLMVPLGIAMVRRGATTDFDALTGTLYDLHKSIGFALLWLVLLRVVVRLARGAPPEPASLPPWQRRVAASVHGLLYGLLVAVPVLGWAGVSAFDARTVFGVASLPAILPPNRPFGERLEAVHGLLGLTLGGLAAFHIAAALRHALRRDGIMRRMW